MVHTSHRNCTVVLGKFIFESNVINLLLDIYLYVYRSDEAANAEI